MRKSIVLVLVLVVAAGLSCHKSNPTGPTVSPTWTESQQLQFLKLTGFGASGGNLVAGAYCSLCEQAYILISSDEGLTWKLDTSVHVYNHFDNGNLSNQLYLPAPLTFLTDGENLLAGVGDVYRGDLYISTDNGISWSDGSMNWPENDSDLTEDFNCFKIVGEVIFAGTSHGIFLSTNHGTNWVAANTGLYDAELKRGYPISGLAAIGSNIFASTYGFGIFHSTDGGASWIKVNSTTFNFNGLATIGTRIFAAAFNDLGNPSTGGIFVSTDNGDNWQHSDVGIADHGIDGICSNGSVPCAATDSSIYMSTDAGTTWKDISSGTLVGGGRYFAVHGDYLFTSNSGFVWRHGPLP